MNNHYTEKTTLLSHIEKEIPQIIFLTGKSSTGKTTLSKELVRHNYQLVELDSIVMESVVKKLNAPEAEAFRGVYRGTAPAQWIDSFFHATRERIGLLLINGPVLVEGALAHNETINKIFTEDLGSFFFLFLLPTNIEEYANRIKKRFEAGIESGKTGLPQDFFKTIGTELINKYLETKEVDPQLEEGIRTFAKWSVEESQQRLAYFEKSGKPITVLEV